ncbi:putative peroxisomal peroxiredoxin [Yarrowia sp. E02]|nr:putative peroxisomal peroxiredoxin [Yarrowia sp. E02]
MPLRAGGEQIPYCYLQLRPRDPEIEGDVAACGIPQPFSSDKELAGKKVVFVSVPGAFTPTCTANHIPPYIENVDKLKAKGVDKVVVLSANDPFVLSAWGRALKAPKDNFVIFASDGNAAFSKSIGQAVDLAAVGFGERTARYAIIVDDGKVIYNEQEPAKGVTVSGFDAVYAKL